VFCFGFVVVSSDRLTFRLIDFQLMDLVTGIGSLAGSRIIYNVAAASVVPAVAVVAAAAVAAAAFVTDSFKLL